MTTLRDFALVLAVLLVAATSHAQQPVDDPPSAGDTLAAGDASPAGAPLEGGAARLPRARALSDRTFASTPARLERGQVLAEGLLMCFVCHSERDPDVRGAPPVAGGKGAGAILWDEPGYRLVAPNITPDPETGAGTWTDDMLARAIREGIGHDGRALHPQMWYSSFCELSDEDLASVVVYLRSIPAVHNPLPERVLPPDLLDEIAEEPEPLTTPVEAPDRTDPVEYGTYLIEAADCMGCHTSWYGERNPGIFGGGNLLEPRGVIRESVFSANITPSPSGISYYDAALFREVMRTGRVKARELAAIMPWTAFRHLPDAELDAIFAALGKLPPVDHNIDNLTPPTPCARCGQEHGLGEYNRPYDNATVELDPAVLAELAGRYVLDDGYAVELVVQDGVLTGDDTGRLYATEDGSFLTQRWGARITFRRDADGRVTHMVSHELREYVAERVR